VVDTARRESLRSRVRAGVTAGTTLRDEVTDSTLKRLLELVVSWISDVEIFYLNERRERTVEQEARWLDAAEFELRENVRMLGIYEAAVAKYGRDVGLL
jgi:hypothetical protein